MKKNISIILVLALCFSLTVPAFAINETNTMGITFSASLDKPALATSDVDQSVVLTVVASSSVSTSSISYTADVASGLTVTALEGDGINVTDATTNLTTGMFSWSAAGGAVTTVTTIAKMTVKVPAGTAAGTYQIGVTGIKLSKDYGMTIIENGAGAYATLTITDEATSTTGINLTAAATNDKPVRVGATNPIKVNVGVGQNYASTEMIITYPSDLVSFNKNSSILGEATITDDGNGTLTLADYGANKTAGADNYVLAFTVGNTTGTAAFAVTEAGLGNGTTAVDADLTPVVDADLGSVSITIENALHTVTLPTDGLFYAENIVVEAGGTFTFYPELSTGGYYDYDMPTATYADGTAATVTATDDGAGWQIENVAGDVTIAAGSRTPKSFGTVTYTGTGADKVTGQTDTATYRDDIVFTIPADVAAGIENGVKYDVAARIGNANYTFGNPTVGGDGSRTYTIPGESVIGTVIITVTATTLEANKVTVSIGGETADGTFDGSEAGASVQVDKTTGSATLTVDTTSGLNKGYNYEVTSSAGNLTKNEDGTYTISGLTADATITINKTINVTGVKNQVDIDGENKSFVTLNSESGSKMWLIQLPNHVDNTTDAVYKYNGQQMHWSADHNNYVLVVISTEAPTITADQFTLETVTATPTIASNYWDVNKSGTVDANDAQLIWNMYNSKYTEFSIAADGSGATVEKFLLADANHDGVLNTDDAVVIINKILNITT